MASDTITVRGTVTKLHFQSAKFCAGRLSPSDGSPADPEADTADSFMGRSEVAFAGNVYVREGELVALRGTWGNHERFGRQFQATERLAEGEVTPEGVASWLAVNGKLHGVGPARAKRIAEKFGADLGDWLRSDPEKIAAEADVPIDVVRTLAKRWSEFEQLNEVGVRLAAYGLTANQVETLYAKFKGGIIAILEDNPYMLLGEVPGLGYKKVDAIARKLGIPDDHPGRIDAAIKFALAEAQRDGSTCLEESQLIDATTDLIGLTSAADIISMRLGSLVGNSKVREAPLPLTNYLALPHAYRDEQSIAAFFGASNRPNPATDPRLVKEFIHRECGKLDGGQKAAVALALSRRAVVIHGGAGSGKTTVMRSIAQGFRRQRRRVALCAPTGKAARRLEEACEGLTASTIHRLLEYGRMGQVEVGTGAVDGSKVFGWDANKAGGSGAIGSFGFNRHAGYPIDASAVIVDEVSMLDAELASALFAAIPDDAAIVLVGDPNQLPPVGAGALLRDAVAGGLLPIAELTGCHRQAGPLKTNCQAILRGEVPQTVAWDEAKDGPGPWYVCRNLHTADAVVDYIRGLSGEWLTGRLGYDPIKDVQFLTARHDGPLGTKALNIMLQAIHQRTLGVHVDQSAEMAATPSKRPKLFVGDKVIQTKNNYNLDLMNGHQGTVIYSTDARFVVRFDDGREVDIPRDCRGEIELSYCLTAHKVQGSEFPCAVVICHKSHSFIQHRNWLYTAATRAKQTCIILGDHDGIRMAAERVVNDQRKTLLSLLAEKCNHVSDDRQAH